MPRKFAYTPNLREGVSSFEVESGRVESRHTTPSTHPLTYLQEGFRPPLQQPPLKTTFWSHFHLPAWGVPIIFTAMFHSHIRQNLRWFPQFFAPKTYSPRFFVLLSQRSFCVISHSSWRLQELRAFSPRFTSFRRGESQDSAKALGAGGTPLIMEHLYFGVRVRWGRGHRPPQIFGSKRSNLAYMKRKLHTTTYYIRWVISFAYTPNLRDPPHRTLLRIL